MPEQNKNVGALIFLIFVALFTGPIGWIILVIWFLSRLKSGTFDQEALKNMLQYNKGSKNTLGTLPGSSSPDLESQTSQPITVKPLLTNQGEIIRGLISLVVFICLIAVIIYFWLK